MAGIKKLSTDKPRPNFRALIAAAGRGNRAALKGSCLPKQYQILAGKPMLRYSAEVFLSHPSCSDVRIIIHPDDADLYQKSVNDLNLRPPFTGGKERNDSVFNALKDYHEAGPEEIILIHDAARPCINHNDIDILIDSLATNRAASLALPISATLRREKSPHVQAGEIVERQGIWAMQTPQGFRKNDLLAAHHYHAKSALDMGKSVTDDTMLVSALGIEVALVHGSPENMKITYPEDFTMAEKILSAQTITLTGLGFDVHAFDKTSSGPVRLCGIDVPHVHKLLGHSDADVGLHALTDALLGALGEGDIGRHFPPSDPTFKNMDSTLFLEKALRLTQDKGAIINNIDLTLICEHPKITPHAAKMRARVAEITNLPEQRINIKATTTEQLGFTGRGEGIAAQAIITLRIPA